MGGVVGLDYSALPVLFESFSVDKTEWQNYMEKITILSEIATAVWNAEITAASKK